MAIDSDVRSTYAITMPRHNSTTMVQRRAGETETAGLVSVGCIAL
jgi:hypothetical protein